MTIIVKFIVPPDSNRDGGNRLNMIKLQVGVEKSIGTIHQSPITA